jgi:hypothetical protein
VAVPRERPPLFLRQHGSLPKLHSGFYAASEDCLFLNTWTLKTAIAVLELFHSRAFLAALGNVELIQWQKKSNPYLGTFDE